MGERTSRVLVIVAAAGALAGGWAAATWLTQPGRGDRSSLRAGSDVAPVATLAEDPEPPPELLAPDAGRVGPPADRQDARPVAPGAPGGANAASSKPIPPVDASASEWAVAIERQRERRNSVALHALIDALPARRDASSRRAGSDAEKTGTEVDPTAERARLLALATSALAAIGVDPRTEPEMRANARRAFDDLLAAPSRDVRLAAMNAFALAYPDEREAVLHDLASDSDPLIRAKAQALLAALR